MTATGSPAFSPGVSDAETARRDRLIDIHAGLARYIARTSRRVHGTISDSLEDGDRSQIRQSAFRGWSRDVALGLLGPVFAEISLHPRSWLWYRATAGQGTWSTQPADIRSRRLDAEKRLENALLLAPVAAALSGGDTDECLMMIWRPIKTIISMVDDAVVTGEYLGADHGVLVNAAGDAGIVRVGERAQARFMDDLDAHGLGR